MKRREGVANLVGYSCEGCTMGESKGCYHPCNQEYFVADKILTYLNIQGEEVMDYLTYRTNALSSLVLLKPKDNFPPNHWTKDDLEAWVKRNYNKHCNKGKE